MFMGFSANYAHLEQPQCDAQLDTRYCPIVLLNGGETVMTYPPPPISIEKGANRILTFWNVVAALLVLGFLVFLAEASRGVGQTLAELRTTPVSLDPANLPNYAARTSLRMLAAMLLSLLFTFTYATWAAKSRRAEVLLIPLLDILQSVPILGFLSITVVFFMSLAPGKVLGAEFAAVFAIFTSQAWNMAFSFYQSLRTVPRDLDEAARSMRLSPWMKFWRLEVPFAVPGLVWNMMMSMSGGWFFVVASEAIGVGSTTVMLPGIGSYIALAIQQKDLGGICWAIATMAIAILIYDQLLFRPLVAWADRFRPEQQPSTQPPTAWVLTVFRGSRLAQQSAQSIARLWGASYRLGAARADRTPHRRGYLPQWLVDGVWLAAIAA